MSFRFKRTTKHISKKDLFEYYKPKLVQGYCESCPNYGKIWSCPPLAVDAETYLSAYEHVLLIGDEIFKTDGIPINTSFQEARQVLGNQLIELSGNTDLEVLIAGNCYCCKSCQREENKSCIYENKCKYSLESLGFLVSDISEKVLEIPLKWGQSGEEPPSLVAVAAILAKEKSQLKEIEL